MTAEPQSTILHLKPHLEAGERLLWSGRPRQGLIIRPRVWLLVGIGALVLLCVALKLAAEPAWRAPDIYQVMAVLGPLGTALTIFTDKLLRARTYYGVTDRRILILREPPQSLVEALCEDFRGSGLTSIELRDLDKVHFNKHADGSGRIPFSRSLWPPTLDFVDGVERVARVIEKARTAAQRQLPVDDGLTLPSLGL